MRRKIGPLFLAVGLLLAAVSAQAQKTSDRIETFTFLDITDTHQTANGSIAPLQQLTQDAINMSPPPAFIIDNGDITESGRPQEYARFKEGIAGLQSAGIRFYAVPGNHDVRWSPEGKEGFVNQFGKLYQSFDYGNVHFILLDSTVVLEHWGHFDKAELDWLKNDLKHVRTDTPVMLFMHHWIGRDAPDVRMIDNEFDLVPILHNHNVMVFFTGHGHADLVWYTNGVLSLMSRGLYQGSYLRVNVTPLLVTIDRFVKEKPGVPVHIATLPTQLKNKPSVLQVAWDDPDIAFLERRRPMALLSPRAVTDNPDKETAQYRIDDGDWKPMTKDARDIWRDQFPTKPISVGVHSCDIRLTTSNNVTYEDELIFEVDHGLSQPTRKWAIDLNDAIQSSPLLAGDTLYVSSLDGHVYALDKERGRRRWSFPTKGQFLASPVIADGVLYIGSTDHNLYALDPASGRPRWHFDTGSPVLASAAEANGVVCVGGNGKIFGLDAATGNMKWTQPAGSFFQSRAATDGEAFYLGGWDNTLYALDVQTGAPRWKAHMGRSFYISPAVASPFVTNDRVYVCTDDNVLHAVNKRTGHDDWTASAPKGDDVFGYSSPVVSGATLYVGGLGGHGDVYALDTETGKFLWRTPTGQTIYDSSPRLAPDGKSLAIMGVRGNVVVLDTANGKQLWTYDLGPGNIFSTPEYDGRVVYTTTMMNDVQAINGPGVGTG
ncbi:MAG TPA: PQQ-binding-like beta-propeller repeat protein [Chthonomonadaceae bacterium]|nr:PQQ-binding-like beta-propeller repeat protein [Chthonomonadaceae bacterium]